MSQRLKQPNLVSSNKSLAPNLNTPFIESDTRTNSFGIKESISSCTLSNYDVSSIITSMKTDSDSTGKFKEPISNLITGKRKANLKTHRGRYILGRQNSNADSKMKETIAEIRQSIHAINQNNDEIHQERKDSKLIEMLTDIRDSLIAMPNEGSSAITNNEVKNAVDDIRKSISMLRNPGASNSRLSGANEIKKFGKARSSGINLNQNDDVMDAILEIHEGVKDLEDNIPTQDPNEARYIYGVVSDIRKSLKLITDGDANTISSNIYLGKSSNPMLNSVNELIKTLAKITQQLELIYKRKIENESERKMKDEVSIDCINEKLDTYINNKKNEAARPYQFVLPPFVPPPVYIAPYCRFSLPSHLSAHPQIPPSSGQLSLSGLKREPSFYAQFPGTQNKNYGRNFPSTFSLSFVGNEDRNGKFDYSPNGAKHIFLCNEL
ncbi:unnamed protein product [Rodentolepis nana]|uniref:Uncharacterized protein n=1 Tax=Rodentolepis nana TaxID=102285 RepID=A0A0R3TJB8_RODNA|nr:unnamed protein product [Rodentolepis nana]